MRQTASKLNFDKQWGKQVAKFPNMSNRLQTKTFVNEGNRLQIKNFVNKANR